jgi:1,4-alpha-glucan branching enzyme
MFRFYQDLIRLSRTNRAVRSRSIDVIWAHDGTRVLAFTRRDGTTELLVVASFANRPYGDGYVMSTSADRLPTGWWREVFNSDAERYGGDNVGNFGAALPCRDGRIDVRLPANGFVVLQRQ